MPLYVWQNADVQQRGMVVAIHGLAMHGTTYDACARQLAEDGYLVIAPDLHGYGRFQSQRRKNGGDLRSDENDLCLLGDSLRRQFPSLPLFFAGESLGGTLALRIAAARPELVDGLILSAPAIKHQNHLSMKTIWDAAVSLAYPSHQVSVSKYIERYYSEDQSIRDEQLQDPLVRTGFSVRQLLSACRVMASTSDCIGNIPADMPVLIMQGQRDKMLGRKNVPLLFSRLKTRNASVRLFPNRGHILLETSHVHQDTLDTVRDWLAQNCRMRTHSWVAKR